MAQTDGDIREKFHKLSHRSASVDGVDPAADWEPVISIGTAAGMVNLSVSALRKYEKEGLLLYHRSGSGRRLLCRADVKRIKLIKHMINELGLNVEGIRRILALLPCWDLKLCAVDERSDCPALHDFTQPCWMIKRRDRGQDCRRCEVYRYGAYCAVTMKMLLHHIDEDM